MPKPEADNQPARYPNQPESVIIGAPPGVPQPTPEPRRPSKRLRLQLLMLAGTLVVVMVGGMLWLLALINQREAEIKTAVSKFENTQLQLEGLANNQFNRSGKLTIFGQLTVDGGLVIPPSDPPTNPQRGQIYYDQSANELRYFNGTQFVPFAAQ